MTVVVGCFALLDRDDGGAVLLSDYRRTIAFDGSLSALSDLASTFAAVESAASQGEWLVVATDYGLGACLEPAFSKRRE